MSKLSLKVLLGVFALMFSASVGLSAAPECSDSPRNAGLFGMMTGVGWHNCNGEIFRKRSKRDFGFVPSDQVGKRYRRSEKGLWKDGLLVQGTKVDDDGTYEGTWEYIDGNPIKGIFKGKVTYVDGTTFNGQIGKLSNKFGGSFDYSAFIGTLTRPDGTELKGKFDKEYTQGRIDTFDQLRLISSSVGKLATANKSSHSSSKLPLLKAEFIKLSDEDRRFIQSRLANLKLYSSSIDSRYGKGTETALNAYNEEYLANADLSKKENTDALLKNILTPQAELSTECKDNPNECTPKKLCEVATQVINDNKVWSEDASAAKHITFVKELGMECGVAEITDPCNLDPNECKVKQLCDKATTDDDGSKSWSADAEAHVELAKEYGLECGVEEVADKRTDIFAAWSDETICKYVNDKGKSIHTAEAKRRGLSCGVEEEKQNLDVNVRSDVELCELATFTTSEGKFWRKRTFTENVTEAKRRGLSCSVGRKESLASYFKNQSLTKRKQIQYALKELGYYKMSIDGLWGNGTRRAFSAFRNSLGLQSRRETYVVSVLLTKVKVPSSFSTSKNTNSSNSSSNKRSKSGLTAIINNPSVAAHQAMAICHPKAEIQAQNEYERRKTRGSGKITCKTTNDIMGWGSDTECKQSSGGGFPGLIPLLLEIDPASMAERAAKDRYNNTLSSCLAQYGWKK